MAITLLTDVSHYQGAIDWAAVARTSYRVGVARMTIGRTTLDERGRANLRAMLGTMPVSGAYGVVGYAEPVEDGAKLLLDEIAAAGADPAKILVMLDAENFSDGKHPTIDQVDRYARQLHADLGRWPIAYCPSWWMSQHGYSAAGRGLANCPWAPSHYLPAPWTESKLLANKPALAFGFKSLGWLQYTSSATSAGISGSIDANVFYGTLAQLRGQMLGQPREDDMPTIEEIEALFTRTGSPTRIALLSLGQRAVNSTIGTSDVDTAGTGSPARKGIADVVGGLPAKLDVTALTADQLVLIGQATANALVVEGVEVRDGKLIVTVAAS
jgi:GH25 family lysozyme M1 (1,4-beta-N-acetylmuramidase)